MDSSQAPISEVWFYSRSDGYRKAIRRSHKVILFVLIVYNDDADLEMSDTWVMHLNDKQYPITSHN